ncbi:TOBE domain-containing protein [Persephonella sp.]
MNRIKAVIKSVESSDSISLVELETAAGKMSAVVVETPDSADYLKTGREVYILFKETEVSIGKDLSGRISLRNRFDCTVLTVEKGKILSRIVMDCKGERIVSIITTRSVESLELKEGDRVTALVKTNEVSLLEMDGNV